MEKHRPKNKGLQLYLKFVVFVIFSHGDYIKSNKVQPYVKFHHIFLEIMFSEAGDNNK